MRGKFFAKVCKNLQI